MASTTARKKNETLTLPAPIVRSLRKQAKAEGLTEAEYIESLLLWDRPISEEAKSKTFAELLPEREEVDEGELDALVEKARTEIYEKRQKMLKRKR